MTVYITSENLIKDLEFKKEVGIRADLTDEVLAVVNNALKKLAENPTSGLKLDDDQIIIGPFGEGFRTEDCCSDVSEVQINFKLFLATDDAETAVRAVDHVMTKLNFTQIDSLILAVPLANVPYISIGSTKTVNEPSAEYDKSVAGILNLWNTLSQEFVVNRKSVINMGWCDLDTDVFKDLYSKTNTKPSSIQVNLKSCCTVPPDLQEFAKENGIKLHTHADPVGILDENFKLKLPRLQLKGDEEGTALDPIWLVKMQSFIKSRGVLADKRLVASFKRT